MFNPLDLTGHTVLVAGASSGIGRATSVYLSRLGARLVLVARRKDELEATREQLQAVARGAKDHVVAPFDLSECEQVPNWLRSVASEHGPLHGLVHSVGIHYLAPLQLLDLAKVEALMRINYYSAVQLLKGLRQKCVAERPASVVWITSVMAAVAGPAVAAYASSKGAMTAACRSFALELANDRIRVNCVAPGHTELGTNQRELLRMTPEQYQQLIDLHPLGIGRTTDVAAATAFLLSDAARWITGTTLTVDGGYTAQ